MSQLVKLIGICRSGTGSAAYGQTEEQQQKQQMTSGSTSLYPEKVHDL